MLAASGDLVVFADADMATPPDELPLLLAALDDRDVALGSRIQPDGSRHARVAAGLAAALGKAFHLLASLWVVGPVQDTQCGFKGFTRDVARDLFARQQVTSIVFDVEVIYLARKRGYSHRRRPDPLGDRRGSRMHAGPAPRDPRRVGPVPDPAPPPGRQRAPERRSAAPDLPGGPCA